MSQWKEETHDYHHDFELRVHNNRENAFCFSEILQPHYHREFELIILRSGRCIFRIGESEIDTKEGDIVIANPMQLHSGYSVEESLVDYVAVVIGPDVFLGNASDEVGNEEVMPFLTGQHMLPNVIRPSEEAYPVVTSVLSQILREHQDRCSGYRLKIRGLLYLLLVQVMRYYDVSPPEGKQVYVRVAQYARFSELFAYLEKHCAEKISLEEAARLTGLSPDYFCRAFKKLCGCTFITYYNRLKIEKAEQLLRTTDMTISEVSDYLSFSSVNYFGKLFKKHKNYSPSACRKTYID